LSDQLATSNFIEIAIAKSQSHLLAIQAKESQRVPNRALIERGDRQVASTLAENPGARFSERAYTHLVEQPEVDEALLEKIALRNDIPLDIFPSSFGASYPGSAKTYLALATPLPG
jgi:uncharacterized protein (DUF2336 family)